MHDNIENSLKRILNFVDLNPYSQTYGYADRDFWSWRTKDFNNGSFQSLIYVLACVKNLETFSGIYKKFNQNNLIDLAYDSYKKGCFKSLEKYGSTQEAFPNEKSFCVTSTLLFDLLSALKVANDIKSLSDKEKSILRNTARFISQNIETHANIGNHLLASLAALGLLSQVFDFEDKKIENGIKEIIKKIKGLWNDEGWIEEYGGADIGYLTLSLHYLTNIDEELLSEKETWIEAIIKFLSNFFHLDGSIGNFYGSRGSSIIYLSGLIQAGYKDVNDFLIQSISNKKIPLQNNLDDTNFSPFINSLVRGAIHLEEKSERNINLPLKNEKYLKIFNHAGFVIIINNSTQVIIDLKNSGTETIYTSTKSTKGNLPSIINKASNDIYCAFSSEYKIVEDSKLTISVYSEFHKVNTKPLNSLNIIGSRLLIPIFNLFPFILKFGKSFLVKRFFKPGKSVGSYSKVITIENYNYDSSDSFVIPKGYEIVSNYIHHPIKMASQNYV